MKKLLGIVVLGLLWCNATYAEKITFPCTYFDGEPFHTFVIDMEKKIVDNEFKFLLKTNYNKGSRGNRVKIAMFIPHEKSRGLMREIHLTEFFLVEKIAFMYISKPITQAYASQIKRNGTAEDFFWTTDEEFHAASKNSISLDCDGDSTN